jgi:drug/metabolite transporter (DMT)-like permease
MKKTELHSNLLLLLTAAIWGLAFVAQRVGAKYVGSFTFNGVRFALCGLSLIPLLIFSKQNFVELPHISQKHFPALLPGIVAGFILFTASSFQQIGLVHAPAGKAAFITGLYIVLVPIMGIFLKQRTHISIWFGVSFATIGLYFLSITESFSIMQADLFELIGAFFWAAHILIIDYYNNKVPTLKFCIIQFFTCSILSMVVALIFERITLTSLQLAAIPIIYGGVFSVGIAYTLQVFAQKHANPSHAAIILSMETVFASIGGLLILHENLGLRGYLGCLLMLTGMLVSQLPNILKPYNSISISSIKKNKSL